MASFFALDINLNSTEYLLSEEESKHCIRVLRYGIGSEIDLLDGKGNQLNVKEEDLPEGVYIYRLEFKVNEKTTTTLGKIILKR